MARRRYPLRPNDGARAVAREYVQNHGWTKEQARKVFGRKSDGRTFSTRRALTDAEQRRLTDAIAREPAKVRATLRACLHLGLRISEVATVEQTRNGARVLGKGTKFREVPLDFDRESSAALREVLREGAATPAAAQAACRRIAAATGLRVTPHVLRHTWATNAMHRGVDPKRLQAALGHCNLKTTLRYLTVG
jgi:integrase